VRRPGDESVLSGQKRYISAVDQADWVLAVARLRDGGGQLRHPGLCVVDPGSRGLERDVIPMPFFGPDRQWTVFFGDVPVTSENLIGGEQAGLAAILTASTQSGSPAPPASSGSDSPGSTAASRTTTSGGCGAPRSAARRRSHIRYRLARIAPLSREMIVNRVAEHSLGLPRSN
jgi:hypothetical protein